MKFVIIRNLESKDVAVLLVKTASAMLDNHISVGIYMNRCSLWHQLKYAFADLDQFSEPVLMTPSALVNSLILGQDVIEFNNGYSPELEFFKYITVGKCIMTETLKFVNCLLCNVLRSLAPGDYLSVDLLHSCRVIWLRARNVVKRIIARHLRKALGKLLMIPAIFLHFELSKLFFIPCLAEMLSERVTKLRWAKYCAIMSC